MHSVSANSNSDPDFAGTLKKIKRLHRAIHGMQTDAESWLMDSGLDQEAAKAEIKRLSERDGLTETEIALYVWACVTADLRESLDEKQKEALVPFIWRRLKLEHEQRVKELSDIMKSLTPQQRKVVNAKNRARLLRSERRKRKSNRHVP